MDGLSLLIDAMQDELQAQKHLAVTLENKLDALRHYDVSRLEALTITEQRQLRNVQAAGRRRQAAAEQVTRLLNPPRRQAVASAREIAAVAPQAAAERLRALASALRAEAEKTQRLNRIHAVATHKLMGHLDHIFRLIAHAGRDIGLYSRGGKRAMLEQNRIVDALA